MTLSHTNAMEATGRQKIQFLVQKMVNGKMNHPVLVSSYRNILYKMMACYHSQCHYTCIQIGRNKDMSYGQHVIGK